MRALDVYLHGHLTGQLILRDNGLTSFQYGEAWLGRADAVPLSLSLPLREQRFSHRACTPFFGGVLPEGRNRRLIAGILGVSEGNDFALLERIGGECAGAVTLLPEGTPTVAQDERAPQPAPSASPVARPRSPPMDQPPPLAGAPGRRLFHARTRELDQEELAKILRKISRQPLLVGTEGLRLSLAGAQDKLPVRLVDGCFALPLGAAASTHILKPATPDYEGLVFNEAFCLALANAAGLATAGFSVGRVADIDYLLLQRFDRRREGGHVTRLHQEDFCQALGIPAELKYQGEGGPSLKRCFALLRSVSSAPVLDLGALLDAVVFNLIIGNNDAHGKNFALLYSADGATHLAPLYDLVSTVFYPSLAPEMAMRIGGQRISDSVTAMDLERLAKETGLAPPLVRRRAVELAEIVLNKVNDVEQPHAVSERMAELVRKRAQTFERRLAR